MSGYKEKIYLTFFIKNGIIEGTGEKYKQKLSY